ncbi:uncharacterized protein LOC115693996 [Syzygium oleosum]|uniref:uncharacterized protein LOC115693996 n=1 Tax=Syzygium oleosum TaxID=219896 RepID=UPI0024BA6791|nr:uncharacterized protein LOC115693996 [Syzygium oleosum]
MDALSRLQAACARAKGILRMVRPKYDVFLNCRGVDSHTCFPDFLYKSLSAAGLQVFRDDAAFSVGNQQIGPEVLHAIRTSRIVIPIISERSVHSKRCLRELTEIMDCRRKHGKSVFPIFYKVNVADLGRQCGNLPDFEEALCEHEMQGRREEVQEWVEALCSLTRIRGWMSQAIANGHEGKLVKMVVAKVLSELEMSWVERSSMFIDSVSHYLSEKRRSQSKCQVFLSLRGADTRYNLAAFLYTSLVAEGIQVFNDDDPSLIGKDCVHEIRNAIDHCKISIPILSSNYASSQWCLEDLAQMVECKRTKGQTILPIFYKVKTSHVRDLSHLFVKHMLRHKEMVDESTYERWERAVAEVGSSRGWVSENIANGHEAVLVKEVVEEVSRLLNNPQTHDPPSPSTEY